MRASTDRDDQLRERFELIVCAPALFNALVTAVELGIFTFLGEDEDRTFDDLLNSISIDAHRLRVLMLALCASGVVEKRSGRFRNSRLASEMLVADGPESWQHILLGWQKIYYPAFADMTAALRDGTNSALERFPGLEPSLYERLAHTPMLEAVFHKAMAAFTLQSMSGLLMNAQLAGTRHLLDIGGGDGTTTVALAEKYPNLKVTVVDLPSVGNLADQIIRHELRHRISIRQGNFFIDDWPEPADAVLFSHVLEVFDDSEISYLLQKAYRVLIPGGRVLIYGFNASNDETSGPQAARLSLYLNILASGKGMAYPASDYARWLTEAGFRSVTIVDRLPYEHGLISGIRQ